MFFRWRISCWPTMVSKDLPVESSIGLVQNPEELSRDYTVNVWMPLRKKKYFALKYLMRFRYNCQFFQLKDNVSGKMVCSRTPTPSWLWFVPSPGERRTSFYHLWNHPVYGWDVTPPASILIYTWCQSTLLWCVLMRVLWVVHSVLWTCSVCSAAPEVLSGGPYSHAADWWSMGILLFSLVTGKVRSFALLSWHSASFESDFFF